MSLRPPATSTTWRGASPQGRPLERRAMRGTKGSRHDLEATQHWQWVWRRTAAEVGVLELSPGQGRQAGREEAQPEREGSCGHAKAAFGFNTCWQGSGQGSDGAGVGHRLPAGPKTQAWGHKETRFHRRGHPQSPLLGRGALHCPAAGPSRGSPTPALHLPLPGLSSPHRGSQAVPRRPLLRAAEVLSQALYSYLYRAAINSQRLAAATRGGRFCPPATLQRQGLICLKHAPRSAACSRGPFPVPRGSHGADGQPERRAFLEDRVSPSPWDVHQGWRLSRGDETGLRGEDAG